MQTDGVVRPLTPMERAMWLTDQAYPLSVVVALRLTPALSENAVQRALDALQRREPLLRVEVAERPGGPVFVETPDPPPIRLDVLADAPGEHWLGVCTERLNARVPSGRAPLMDAALLLLADGQACDLVLRFHHSIVDGATLASLVRALLAYGTGDGDSTGPPAAFRLDQPGRLMPSLGARLNFLVRELRGDLAYRRRRRASPPPPVRSDSRCRAHALHLTPDETRRFVRACRQAGVTLHGALLAALALDLRQTTGLPPNTDVRFVSFADLRPHLSEPDRSKAGAHVGMMRHTGTISADADLWAVARACDARVGEAVRRGDALTGAALSPLAMRHTLRSGRDRMGDVALSYLGPVDLPVRSGRHTLTHVHAFISSNPLAPVLSGFAHLFDRRLYLGLMTLTGDPLAADTLDERVRRRLLEATA